MNKKIRYRSLVLGLLVGDFLVLALSLWLTLFLRYWQIPSETFFIKRLASFSSIFAVWLLIFYIADLYGRSFYLYRKNLLNLLLAAQGANGLIATACFYFLPYYGIAPKTILFIDIVVSFTLLFLWRNAVRFLLKLNAKENLALVGSGPELKELAVELTRNEQYGFKVSIKIDSARLADDFVGCGKKILDEALAKEKNIIFVIESFKDLPKEAVEYLYDLMFRGVEFFNFQSFYESIFQCAPLSLVDDEWLLSNISSGRQIFYDFFKRLIDVLAALFFGLISLVFYPFIILAIKLDDGGPVFFINSRVGQKNEVFRQIKFRTMCVNADARWLDKNDKQITRIGRFLRRTRLDELPQLWNVLKGDMSFVGPRPDFTEFAKTLEAEIPYYNIRNLIKPGLTGWAQIQQLPPRSVEETHKRLAYDIYYIKNRSLLLDLTIILQTVRTVLSTSGT